LLKAVTEGTPPIIAIADCRNNDSVCYRNKLWPLTRKQLARFCRSDPIERIYNPPQAISLEQFLTTPFAVPECCTAIDRTQQIVNLVSLLY
jgi:hypothetical protein